MSDYTQIIGLTIIIAVFIVSNMLILHRQHKKALKQAEALSRKKEAVRSQHLTEEEQTMQIVGKDRYQAMVDRVDMLLLLHRNDNSLPLSLTAGPVSEKGSVCLHNLLPGDALSLIPRMVDSMECVDVYSSGSLVGRLMLTEAHEAINVLRNCNVTGIYVAEQNCFGDTDFLSLEIIIFYQPQDELKVVEEINCRNCRINFSDASSMILCQN